jgi:hypothetical protein
LFDISIFSNGTVGEFSRSTERPTLVAGEFHNCSFDLAMDVYAAYKYS